MSQTQMCYLPPDLVVGPAVDLQSSLWHLPGDVWTKIWRRVGGESVRVAILDTGITDHSDLPRPLAARSFVGGDVGDRNGHGNHCAGTAIGRNGIGVAPRSELIVGKVLSDSGSGSSQGIADAIRWATDQGSDVISMSLGGGGFFAPMQAACQYALSRGAVVIAAAGNAGWNGANTIDFPGKYAETICVGAFRRDRSIANFSSGGRELDIACPGQDIISAGHRGGRVSMSGTSMATPFAAGLFALIIELMRREGRASFTGVEAVRAFLKQYSDDAGAPGRDDRFGVGIPNSERIVAELVADDISLLTQRLI